MKSQLSESKVYSGKYLGIPYEIRQWSLDGSSTIWNYYIFLIEKQIPDDFKGVWLQGRRSGRHVFYDYYKSWISDLDWHMGCTFYEKVGGFDGSNRVVKVGCDYAHLYDKGRFYDLATVESDVERCIESLVARVKVLQWCQYCGEYVESVDSRNYCENCPPKKDD